MVTKSRDTYVSPAVFNPGTAASLPLILGTTTRYDQFDMSYHWSDLYIWVTAVAAATPPSSLVGDGVLNAIRNIKVEVNENGSPRTVVNVSGIGCLEYVTKAAQNLDTGTLNLIADHTKGTPALIASTTYRFCYRVPLVHPRVTEPLRTPMLLPVPHHQSSPILTLDWSTGAAMFGAGTLTNLFCEVSIERREVPPGVDAAIIKAGGYMPFDFIETPWTPGVGVSGEQHVPINQPGAYGALMFRMYLGGSTVTRADISQTTTAGSEDKWKLQHGNEVVKEWRNKYITGRNCFSNVLNIGNQTYSPNAAGGLVASTSLFQKDNSMYHDFLTGNGISDCVDLGGVLDCFLPANPGQRMELIGNIASVATNSSTIYMLGHRYLNQQLVANWQAA